MFLVCKKSENRKNKKMVGKKKTGFSILFCVESTQLTELSRCTPVSGVGKTVLGGKSMVQFLEV